MNLEKIHEMWAEDSKINGDLDDASRRTPILHSKYLDILSRERMKLVKFEMDQKTLLKDKWLWYNGKMTKERMDQLGWDYDPVDGLKILKGEMDYYYDSDPEIQESELKIKLQKEKIDILKEIIDNLKWRHQTIRNIIEHKKFEAGI